MSRKTTPKPAAKPVDAAVGDQTSLQAAAQVAPVPESTLGDGDAAGAQAKAMAADAAPKASTPDLVNAPDSNPPSDNTPGTGPKGVTVRVVGPARGRWRAGRSFGPTPVEIPASDLTDAEMEKLIGDPELIVAVIPAT